MPVDRPLIFSAPMIHALLDERKTMTRRLLKPQPHPWSTEFVISSGKWSGIGPSKVTGGTAQWDPWRQLFCNADDRLWARETWRTLRRFDSDKPGRVDVGSWIAYEADPNVFDARPVPLGRMGKLRPSIFMPRWMSRVTLIVTAVKIESLNDITEEDALAEGIVAHKNGGYWVPGVEHPNRDFPYLSRTTPREMFAALWDTIHGSGAWLQNPKIVALSFQVERRNIDTGGRSWP